ncbi:MAG TPA: dihydrofolate reductase family protein [Patescibacteria group bacterium]
MINRPITTLFMIESLDGKISTGDNDTLDVDRDFPKIPIVKDGLSQYYEIESHTDRISLNTGRVMAKIGVNIRKTEPKKIDVDFVIIDSKPHLTEKGVEYLAKWVRKLYLVTTNKNHPAFKVRNSYKNIFPIYFEKNIDLSELLILLKEKYVAKRITIQSGGTLNASWIREGLIDRVKIVIAPCLIGGANTQSLIGGESLHNEKDLGLIKPLSLLSIKKLKYSYLEVVYRVLNKI